MEKCLLFPFGLLCLLVVIAGIGYANAAFRSAGAATPRLVELKIKPRMVYLSGNFPLFLPIFGLSDQSCFMHSFAAI